MFCEIASRWNHEKRAFLPFSPYAAIQDREAWEQLDEEWKNKTVELGEQYLGFSWPYLSAADFLDFFYTGNRVRFEDRYFAKRHALNALVLAECVENNGRFLDDIINGVFSICDENAWNLPPHNSYQRDAPQLPLPDLSTPVLDLFACETGAVLAAALYLLLPKFNEFSPVISRRIRFELDRRIFTPYLNYHFWWMGDGISPMNNWTIWCTQNVLLAAFLADVNNLTEESRYAVFQQACRSADFFLADYGEDGCCDEGAQYYRHAGLCLFQVLDLCNAVTEGAFETLAHNGKIKNIASYIHKVHINDKYYINFADCSPIAGRAGVREYLFAKLTDQPEMMRFAAIDFKAGESNSLLLPEENNLYYRLQNAFTIAEIKSCAADAPLQHSDVYYPSVGVFAVRDEKLFLAVKAGDNGDGHNHNDTGSFIIYKNGKPLFIDVGVESYTKKTFSAKRYEIWTMQSAYHNLPTIDGIMQAAGEKYGASEVSCNLTRGEISMELIHAYPACGLASYRRHIRLIRGESILIHDHIAFLDGSDQIADHQVVLSLMTYEKPVVVHTADDTAQTHLYIGGGHISPADPDRGQLEVTGAHVIAVEEIPITDPRLQKTWEHEIYRILLEADDVELTLRIS